MGALARGTLVLNPELVRAGVLQPATVERVAAREAERLEQRERAYRTGRRPPEVAGRGAILVDDGLATGSSMLAAIQALREQGAGPVTVGIPVAPASSCLAVARDADEIVCVSTPRPFVAVGQWYSDFSEVDDEQVRRLLCGG
jgi:predicted phosphoribosyltransferase